MSETQCTTPWECPRCGKEGLVNLTALGPLGAVRCTCGTASRPKN